MIGSPSHCLLTECQSSTRADLEFAAKMALPVNEVKVLLRRKHKNAENIDLQG